jgi:hypothetical protein
MSGDLAATDVAIAPGRYHCCCRDDMRNTLAELSKDFSSVTHPSLSSAPLSTVDPDHSDASICQSHSESAQYLLTIPSNFPYGSIPSKVPEGLMCCIMGCPFLWQGSAVAAFITF